MVKVAVVILNWNGRKMLERFLPSLIEHSCKEATIIVADNASTDDSLQWMGEHYPNIDTIVLDYNYGFAEGYNKVLKKIEAEYFILLNSDVEVGSHWLAPLVEYMDLHTDVAACQPKLLAYHNKSSFEYAGASGGYIDRFGYPFCRGRLFETVEKDNGQYDTTTDILWASGACLMIRSKDYWEVGGLDGRFFAHNEEIDLCWRLRLAGRRVVCLPQSHVFHVGGGTLPKGNSRKTYLNFRNNLTMLYKNLSEAELRSVMRWRWFLDYFAAWQTLIFKGNWGDFCAIYRARKDFKRWLPQFEEDRKRIQTMRQNTNIPEKKSYSILWQYYIKKHRLFSELP